MVLIGAFLDDMLGPSGQFSAFGTINANIFALNTTTRPGKAAGVTEENGTTSSTFSVAPLRVASKRSRGLIR